MKTIGKLFTLTAIVLLSLYLVDRLSTMDQEVINFKNIVESSNSHSVAFVGSSRTMRGINPALLNEHIQSHEFINLGISGSTFHSNYFVTNYIIEQSKCGNIIFELSPIISSSPEFTHCLAKHLNLNLYSSLAGIKSHDQGSNFRFKVNLLNDHLSNKLFIKQKVKRLFNIERKDSFGYFEEYTNQIKSTESILKPAELELQASDFDLSMYHNAISYLILNAEKHNKRIIFMLPSTFRKELEKNIVIPLYYQIPAENRLIYDKDILIVLNRSELLLDANHFNAKGAKVFTIEIARLLQNQGIVNTSLPTP